MKRCPNCGRETARTEDWACQWCGYPLLSSGYKKISKTYQELQEERGLQRTPEQEAPEPELAVEPESEPISEPGEAELEPEPEPEREPVAEMPPEPPPVPEAAPKRRKRAKPQSKAAPSVPEPEAAAEPELAAGIEPEPEAVAEPEQVLEAEPEQEEVSESELEGVPEPQPEPAPPPRAAKEVDFTAEVVEVDIRDLSAVYHKDKAATGAKLTDKIIKVTGTVDRAVVNPGLDIYYVLLTSNESNSWNVRCTFEPENGIDLRGLVRGHVVTIQGKYAGYERNILLKDCILVR